MARVLPHGRKGAILGALRGPCGVWFWLLFFSQLLAQNQTCVDREISIPWDKAPPNGLDALLVYFNLPGRHPLVVLTHGSAREMEKHAEVTPWQELPQRLW